MVEHNIVSPDAWTEARKALLEKEKAFMTARDALIRERTAMPWVRVETDYVFEGEVGSVALDDLFEGRSQLIVSHFMFHPDWDEGCKSCSFWADGYDNLVVHLNARDVSFVSISRAPLQILLAYRKRMDWSFVWVSSAKNNFNSDFGVTFSPDDIEKGEVVYNYKRGARAGEEMPGLSIFIRDDDGAIYHTYSCYARGLDMMNATYQLLDLVPKGGDESELPFTIAWRRRHDEYGAGA